MTQTPITRSVHCKSNSFTVALDMTQHGFYIIQNVNNKFIYKTYFSLSVYKQDPWESKHYFTKHKLLYYLAA